MIKGGCGQTNQLYAIKLGALNHAARARHTCNYYLYKWCGVCMHVIYKCICACACREGGRGALLFMYEK